MPQPPAAPDARRPPPARLRRGIALILTLLVLTILIILVTQLRLTTRMNVTRARSFTGDLQNVYGVRAGLEFARLYVLVDTELAANVDHLHEPWAQPFSVPDAADAQIQVRLEDEERRLNLNRLSLPDGKPNPAVRAQLAKLVAVLGIRDEKLAPRIIDYIDPDHEGEYEGGAKNAPLVIPEELVMIPGVKPEHLYGGIDPDTHQPFRGLLDYVTLWPIPEAAPPPPEQAGRDVEGRKQPPPPPPDQPPPPAPDGQPRARYGVNINTAPVEVILSLSPLMFPELAQGIVSYRDTADSQGHYYSFNDVQDLYKVQGMTKQIEESIRDEIVFRSQVFSARVASSSRNLTKRVRYVLDRGQPGAPPKLLTWWDEGGAFGVPEPGRER